MEQKTAALATFSKHQIASVSLLQRTLKLNYDEGVAMMESLVADGVVSEKRPDGTRVLCTLPDLREFADKVFETAVSFREYHRLNNDGHTEAIKLLRPYSDVPPRELRQFMLGLYRDKGLSVLEAADRLVDWTHPRIVPTKLDPAAVKRYLKSLWGEHEAHYARTPWPSDPVDSEFHRLARYIHMEWRHGRSGHTGVYNFISKAFVPRGKGRRGGGHGEHVVPRKFLIEHCKQMFCDGRTIHEVAQLCREHTIVVDISKEQAQYLDRSISLGGLGLKTVMPSAWNFAEGCVFARLHVAGITFDPPASMPACKCSNSEQP